jgi:hypothetical protein
MIEVSLDDSFTDDDNEYHDQPVSRQLPIGVKLTLEPGFVNAKRRHPSGRRLFVRGRSTASPVPHVRLPAMVSCPCGQDVFLRTGGDFASGNATMRANALNSALYDEGAEAAEDEWIRKEAEHRGFGE